MDDKKTDAEKGIKKFVLRIELELDHEVHALARSEKRAKNPMLLILIKEALVARESVKKKEPDRVVLPIDTDNPAFYQGKLVVLRKFDLVTLVANGKTTSSIQVGIEIPGETKLVMCKLEELTPYSYVPTVVTPAVKAVSEDSYKEPSPVPSELL